MHSVFFSEGGAFHRRVTEPKLAWRVEFRIVHYNLFGSGRTTAVSGGSYGLKNTFFTSVQPSQFCIFLVGSGGTAHSRGKGWTSLEVPEANQGYQGMARLIVHLPGRVLRGSSNLEEARAPKHLLLYSEGPSLEQEPITQGLHLRY